MVTSPERNVPRCGNEPPEHGCAEPGPSSEVGKIRTYRSCWLRTCSAIALIGLVAGLVAAPGTMALAAASAAVIGAIVAIEIWCDSTFLGLDAGLGSLLLRGAALTGLAAAVVLGLSVVLGGMLLPAALVLTLTSPQLVWTFRRWLSGAPRPSAAQIGAAMSATSWVSAGAQVDEVVQLSDLTNEELCRRWRTTWATPTTPAAPDTWVSLFAQLDAVEERGQLLEEIERRNPTGFVAWIASEDPQAATLPCYLNTSSSSCEHQVDWDSLLP